MNGQMDGQRDMMFILDRFMNEVQLGWIQQKKASERFFALHIFLSNKNNPTTAATATAATTTTTTTGCV